MTFTDIVITVSIGTFVGIVIGCIVTLFEKQE